MKRLLDVSLILALACCALAVVSASAQETAHGVTQDQTESLAEIMRQAVKQKQVAGCSFFVTHKGEVVFRKAVGFADFESKRPFTTEELLPIASVSKPFLASVLMVLIEQGKLRLDDPVEKYLPEFKGIKVKGSQSPARRMTIRHLLSHTAGFWGNKGITPEKLDLIRNFERPLSDAVKRMSEYDLVYEPGTKFLYSGTGYCVAGRVAEVVLGQSLEQIAQDALFRPLGLNNTTFLPSKELRKTVPAAYLRKDGKLQRQPSRTGVDLRFILPGGSLFTTLDELAVFGQMHLNDGVYNGQRILSKASVTEMRRLQSPDRPQRTYGLGWFRGDVSESGLADQVFHGGALGAHLRIDRRRDVVCVFLVHQTAVQVQDLKNKLVEQVNEMFPVSKSHPDRPAPTGSNAIKQQILKLFPQADTNKDGVLSDAEEAAVCREALKRFPKADKDGDGKLSDAEKKALLRAAANRAKRKSAKPTADTTKKKPSFANVKYGEHERHVFDIWPADTDKPAPLAIYIHGGGFKVGSKEKLKLDELSQLLKAGISVAAINYRYVTIAPLPAAHHDARRALQFMRSKADEWNIDKERVAAFGGSAAQICMWLAFTNEMAKPDSPDPIERESTRLTCVATAGGQTSNGAEFWRKTIGPLLGDDRKLESLSKPLGKEKDPEKVRIETWGAKTLKEANEIAARHSALDIVSADDPPIFMSYSMSPRDKLPRDPKRVRGWLIHHVNLGIALKEKTDSLNLEAHLKYPGAKPKYESLVEFFVDKLWEK